MPPLNGTSNPNGLIAKPGIVTGLVPPLNGTSNPNGLIAKPGIVPLVLQVRRQSPGGSEVRVDTEPPHSCCRYGARALAVARCGLTPSRPTRVAGTAPEPTRTSLDGTPGGPSPSSPQRPSGQLAHHSMGLPEGPALRVLRGLLDNSHITRWDSRPRSTEHPTQRINREARDRNRARAPAQRNIQPNGLIAKPGIVTGLVPPLNGTSNPTDGGTAGAGGTGGCSANGGAGGPAAAPPEPVVPVAVRPTAGPAGRRRHRRSRWYRWPGWRAGRRTYSEFLVMRCNSVRRLACRSADI